MKEHEEEEECLLFLCHSRIADPNNDNDILLLFIMLGGMSGKQIEEQRLVEFFNLKYHNKVIM
jgi:hypothetical protein